MTALPPHDLPAERAVLGGILHDPVVLHAVRAIVSSESFYLDAHRRIFSSLIALADGSAPIDLPSLAGAMQRSHDLADAGGEVYLAELFTDSATGANAEYYARIVHDRATTRAVMHAANEILRDARDGSLPAEELLASAERMIFAIAERHQQPQHSAKHIRLAVRALLQEIDDRASRNAELSGLSCGYTDLDDMLGGLRPGELLVIGARPSVGKTALALNIAASIAGGGKPVFMASLEMPSRELAGRLLAMGSGVPMQRITRGRGLSAEEAERIAGAASDDGIGGSPIYVDDTAAQQPAHIAATCRRLIRKYNVALAAVDYLQLMRPENPRENRTQQVGMLTLRMKHIARDCDIPIILLSQLNRDLEHGARKPRLSDLRESGDIEAHADRVLLLHRDPKQDQDDPIWPIDVIVAKNRNGPTGDIRLGYNRAAMRFENMAKGLS